MAHESQMSFFKAAIAEFPAHFSGRVLDVGSFDINGGPQNLITPMEYVGVDLVPGPNVTLIGRGENLDFPDHYFDVAMSSECFEHNEAWQATLRNMIRMTRPSGLVIFTAASTGRPEHGTTRSDGGRAFPGLGTIEGEWYQNLNRSSVMKAVKRSSLSYIEVNVNKATSDLCFIALVSPSIQGDIEAAERVMSQHTLKTRGNTYPGSRPRRLVIQLFGDPGLAFARALRRVTRGLSHSKAPTEESPSGI
jgi:SAM-dependent methyltransferase